MPGSKPTDLLVPAMAASVLGAGGVIGLALALVGPLGGSPVAAAAGHRTGGTPASVSTSTSTTTEQRSPRSTSGPSEPRPVVVATGTSSSRRARPRSQPTAASPEVPEIRRTVMAARTAPPPVTVALPEPTGGAPTVHPGTGPSTGPATWRRSVVAVGNARPSGASVP